MKEIYTLSIFILWATSLNGQSLSRSSINCFGNSTLSENILYRQSVGQSSNTEVFTNGLVLRQGFQQCISIDERHTDQNSTNLSIYPNPATNKIIVCLRIADSVYSEIKVAITDILGRDLISISNYVPNTEINTSCLPAGNYILSVFLKNSSYASAELIINK